LAIQTHQQTGKTPYRLQSPLLEAGLYLYNTRFTKVDGVPGYASEKNGIIILIKLNELAILCARSGEFMVFPTHTGMSGGL
jgi:hypothetical protein